MDLAALKPFRQCVVRLSAYFHVYHRLKRERPKFFEIAGLLIIILSYQFLDRMPKSLEVCSDNFNFVSLQCKT